MSASERSFPKQMQFIIVKAFEEATRSKVCLNRLYARHSYADYWRPKIRDGDLCTSECFDADHRMTKCARYSAHIRRPSYYQIGCYQDPNQLAIARKAHFASLVVTPETWAAFRATDCTAQVDVMRPWANATGTYDLTGIDVRMIYVQEGVLKFVPKTIVRRDGKPIIIKTNNWEKSTIESTGLITFVVNYCYWGKNCFDLDPVSAAAVEIFVPDPKPRTQIVVKMSDPARYPVRFYSSAPCSITFNEEPVVPAHRRGQKNYD